MLDHRRVIPSGWTDAEWEMLVDARTRRKLIKPGLALTRFTILLTGGGDDQPPSATPGGAGLMSAPEPFEFALNQGGRTVFAEFGSVAAVPE
jgi:hypothetical protein